jgi:hypothetical protein
MKRFKVISLHPYTDCNLNCSFCYKEKNDVKKPKGYWLGLVPYLKELTDQVALGGGEPFMHPAFIKEFSDSCKKNKLLFNVTSNGKLLFDMTNKELKSALKGITMISISFDREKIKDKEDFKKYHILVQKIKNHTDTQVGCNLLINEKMLSQNGIPFIMLCKFLFEQTGIDRLFCLYPKNIKCVDISKFKQIYQFLTLKYKKFFIDDLTKEILEQGMIDWHTPCHYGKDLISINEKGLVTGCSFDADSKSVLEIKEPKDILKVKDIKFENRYICPYLKR